MASPAKPAIRMSPKMDNAIILQILPAFSIPMPLYRCSFPLIFFVPLTPSTRPTIADARAINPNTNAKDLKAKAANYCPVKVKLVKGINDFIITFKPDENYRPGEKMRMAQYDKDLKQYV